MSFDHRAGFGLLFLAGGMMGLMSGCEQLIKHLALLRRAVRQQATITKVRKDVQPVADSDSGAELEYYYPTVKFQAGSKTIEIELSKGTLDKKLYRRGQPLTVFFDPLNSKNVAARRRDWLGGMILTLMSMAFVAIGAGLLWIWNADQK